MEKYIRLLNEIFDSERCVEYIKGIWENDRFFDYKSFAKTADYCLKAFEKAGLSEIERLTVVANGKKAYGDWVMPRAWDVENASLEAVGEDWVLADYAKTPCSLVMYSAPTPPEGIEAECVLVDDLENMPNAEGKLIFTTLPASSAAEVAVKSKAVGIISDYIRLYPGVRDNREMVRDTSMWVNNFKVPMNDTELFAFSLSPRNGDKLRERLLKGEKVKLKATVNTRAYDGEAYTVSGLIPGETDEEICFYGHLYEPGAHDNASGCGAIIELARCVNEGIRQGKLPKPKLGLRFILGPECAGSAAYFTTHEERKGRYCFVLDMVGTQKTDNTHLSIWHNPLSNMSLIDSLTVAAAEKYGELYKPFEWDNRPFILGTDNVLGDPSFNMPSVALIAEPALSYHSSMDTPDRIEPDTLRRNAVIAGAGALTLAFGEKCSSRACRVPVRLVKGCLTLESRPELKEEKWKPAWSGRLNIPLFWMDGKRTLWEIASLSASELEEKDVYAYFEELCEYTEFLHKHKYIDFLEG